MINESIFSGAGNAVILGWLALIAAVLCRADGRYSRWLSITGGRVIPIVLSIVYLVIFVIVASGGSEGNLFSLRGIVAKFASDDRLFLLYLEVLTFSLFIGGWIVEDARTRAVSRWLVMFALPIQFVFGPLGLLAYLASAKLRDSWFRRRQRSPAGG